MYQVGQRMSNGRVYNPRPLAQRLQSMRQSKPATPAAAPAAAPTPAAPITPTPNPQMMQAFQGPTAQTNPGVANALYPSVRAFEPKAYEGSPLYKFQMDQGLRNLNRLYASRGLTGSGAEIEGNARFMNELGGNEAQRASTIAQQEADRLERIQQNESIRLQNEGNERWNRLYQTLGLMTQASPMAAAYQAAGGLSDLSLKEGSTMGQYLASMYPRSSGGGGGGGGGSSMPFIPPQPGGPDYSNVNQANFLNQAYQQANNSNLFSSILSSIL